VEHSLEISTTDALILAGGLGTRLRPQLKDVPKVLAPVKGKPFLEILIDNLVEQGFQKIILCLGYMKDQVINHFMERDDCKIIFSIENKPLGTAGGIKNAEDKIQSSPFIVLNGDSFCRIIYKDFINFHADMKAFVTLGLVSKDKNEDFGSIKLENDKKTIVSFNEKIESNSRYINAGVYCMEKEFLKCIPPNSKVSLEYDIFPNLIGGKFFGYISDENMIDIGTPETYEIARKFLK